MSVPQAVHAGPVEILADVAVNPADPQQIVLGYENGFAGLLVSSDGGHTFRLRPSESIHSLMQDTYFPREDFPIVFSGGALLVGGTAGLLAGDAETCGLTQSAILLDDPALGLAPHPTDPDQAFVAITKTKAARGGLFRRDRTGTLMPLGKEDADNTVVTDLRVVVREASTEHLRFFEGGARGAQGAAKPTPFVRYSDDLGATWTEHPVALPGAGTMKVLAVDPLDPDRILVMGDNEPRDAAPGTDPADDVLLSLNAGQTFTPYTTQIRAAQYSTFAPDGRFWLGDQAGGLYFAARLGDPLSKVSELPVHGLYYEHASDTLLLIQGYEVGRLKLADYSYCQMFRIYEALAFANCAGDQISSDPDTKSQVCQSYCNATHFWYAPVCKQYDDVAAACGLGVLHTEFSMQLPNTMNSSARCEGYPLHYDDPTAAGAMDAGTQAPGAGIPVVAADSGAIVTTATMADAALNLGADAGLPAAAAAPPPAAHHDGGCSVHGAGAAKQPWSGLAALFLLCGSVVRRSVRKRRTIAAPALLTLALLGALDGCGDDAGGGNGDGVGQADAGAAGDEAMSAAPAMAGVVACPTEVARSPLAVAGAGQKGVLTAKVVEADYDPARKYLNNWKIDLTTAAGQAVDDAHFENQRTYMPVHGHDGKFPPTITRDASAPGRYQFEGINFTMTGPWQVQFDVSSASASADQFILNVCVGE